MNETAAVILAVDDELADVENLERVLGESGYKVITARAGQQALQAHAQQGRIDLLVTDIAMAPMNGRELAHTLLERQKDLRVIFVSGYVGEQALRDDSSFPGAAFLRKPFAAEDLKRMVRAALNGHLRRSAGVAGNFDSSLTPL
jgi:CheY-like chemotaxis protein